jgi:hypothetical protein
MESKTINQEESLSKLISILKIVELDFECLSCDKVKSGFLNDLTNRLQKKILDRQYSPSNSKKGNSILILKQERLFSIFLQIKFI